MGGVAPNAPPTISGRPAARSQEAPRDSRETPKRRPEAPRAVQEATKIRPRGGPQRLPRGPQQAPRGPKSPPGGPQNTSKSLPDTFHEASRRPFVHDPFVAIAVPAFLPCRRGHFGASLARVDPASGLGIYFSGLWQGALDRSGFEEVLLSRALGAVFGSRGRLTPIRDDKLRSGGARTGSS